MEQEKNDIVETASGCDSATLLESLYRDLRRLAASKLAREAPGHSFRATDLVHEAYLRLIKSPEARWNGPGHFYGAASLAMRRILVERARKSRAMTRCVDRIEAPGDANPLDILALDDALTLLAERYPQHAEVVHLRFFAGLTIAESARILGVSETTVENRWAFARSWLQVSMMDHTP